MKKNNKEYNLFLDDDPKRIPGKLFWIELPKVDWVIVRNYEEFVHTIKRDGLPSMVSFDHDLGKSSYQEFHRAFNSHDKKINYDNIQEKTGYHCAKFLVDYCIKYLLEFPNYYVHSMNTIGKENIISLIESFRKFQKS